MRCRRHCSITLNFITIAEDVIQQMDIYPQPNMNLNGENCNMWLNRLSTLLGEDHIDLV